MCGLLGIIGRSPPTIKAAALEAALNTIKHRGPDDEGYLFFDASSGRAIEAAGSDTDHRLPPAIHVASCSAEFDIAFAHRRLSVLDVSPAGHQPLTSIDRRYWIVLNGEIYNFLELRADLARRGYDFRTSTDTEVILAAYAEWGVGMLSRLIGMFAMAILDVAKGTVLLARDPFGIKPLYLRRIGQALVFASEISPLLSLTRSAPPADVDALYQYLRFGVTDGSIGTMFGDIHQLPAAHYTVVGADGVELAAAQSYWQPGSVPRRSISLADAGVELSGQLDESVRLHLRSDVPLGTCLSGGLDSTAIVASMRAQLGPEAPIHSFSFESDDPRTGEGAYVDIATRAFGLQGHSVSPTADDLATDLSALIRVQEQPFGSTSIYAQYCVFRLAHKAGMTVMLDGQGADELFGGYATAISAQLAATLLRGRFASARALASSSHHSAPGVRKRILLSAGGRLLPKTLVAPFMSFVGESLYPKWLNGEWFRGHGHLAESRAQGRGRDALREELLHFVRTLSLPQLLRYEDRNSMAFSIESRVPFCTVSLADFAFSLPPSLLVGPDGETKSVLRRAVAGIVPREIIERPKVGFETPERSWLRTLAPLVREVVTSDAFRALPFLNHQVVENVLIEQLSGDRHVTPMAWRVLNVALWARQFAVAF